MFIFFCSFIFTNDVDLDGNNLNSIPEGCNIIDMPDIETFPGRDNFRKM